MDAPETISSQLWRGLLPPGVIAFETRDFHHSPLLWPEEWPAVRNAVPKRVEEFAAGRACARRALGELGYPPAALLRGADRVPVWPKGIVGSITHTDGYCGAAVARSDAFVGLGIDVERIGRVDEEIERQVCTPGECAGLAAFDSVRRAEVATILFSAKEAFFKCQYAAGGGLSEFHDIELDLDDGAFRVRVLRPSPLRGSIEGRYAVAGGMAFTAIALLV